MSVPAVAAGTAAKGVKDRLGSAPALVPATVLGIGLYLVWFGVHYWHTDTKWPTDPVKAVLTGKPVPPATRASDTLPANAGAPISGVAVGGVQNLANNLASGNVTTNIPGGGPSSATTSGLAQTALRFVGTGYAWGGKANAPGNWDCSSFVSYCLHASGLSLPGGRWGDPGYPPNAHGPTTGTYLTYGTPVNRAQVAAGDLIVWPTHMGIAIDTTRMVSARNPRDGVGINPFDHFMASEIAQYRRPR